MKRLTGLAALLVFQVGTVVASPDSTVTVAATLSASDSAIAVPASTVEAVDAMTAADPIVVPGIELPDTYGLLARTTLSLVAVLALIWGAVLLLRRLSPEGSGHGKGQIRVLERAHLAPKRALYVVQVGRKALALGVTEESVSLLTELDLDETLDAYPQRNGTRTTAFSAVFDSVKAKIGTRPEAAS